MFYILKKPLGFLKFIYYGFSMGYVIGNVFIDKPKCLSSILNL